MDRCRHLLLLVLQELLIFNHSLLVLQLLYHLSGLDSLYKVLVYERLLAWRIELYLLLRDG